MKSNLPIEEKAREGEKEGKVPIGEEVKKTGSGYIHITERFKEFYSYIKQNPIETN